MAPPEPRTVTAPVSGRKVRLPTLRAHLNGVATDLFALTENTVKALDIHLLDLDFGYVTIRVAHGRVAGFDVMQTHKVLDDLVGQPPPRVKAGVA